MSEITNYLGGYLNELNNYIDRLNTDRLSRKDKKLFLEMSNEYYDVFKESLNGSEINQFPAELLDAIAAFNDNISSQEDRSNELANQYHDAIVGLSDDYIKTVERLELQFGIFHNDAEILRLQEEKTQMLQRLVDLEIQKDGQISPETAEILEVQHSEIVNGQVRVIGAWEQREPLADESMEKEHPAAINPEISKERQRVKLQLPYMRRETFLEVKEELKRMGAKFDAKEKMWYVEQSVGQDVIDHINEYLAKHDDAIYLKLPFTEDTQKFKQILGDIKQNGARYNPFKKRWYITETMDQSKFFTYLPTSELLFKREKDSVHQKLNQYKEGVKTASAGPELERHKKDTPERI